MKTIGSIFQPPSVITTMPKQKMLNASILPDDLIVEIFSYLFKEKEHNECKLVCRHWCAVATDNDLLRPLFEKRYMTLPNYPVPNGYFYQFELFNRRANRLNNNQQKDHLFKGIISKKKPEDMLPFLKSNEKFLSNLHLLIMSPFSHSPPEDILKSFRYISTKCPNLEVVDFSGCNGIDSRVMLLNQAYIQRCPKKPTVHLGSFASPAEKKVHDHYLTKRGDASSLKISTR